jgi:hypothetical protein
MMVAGPGCGGSKIAVAEDGGSVRDSVSDGANGNVAESGRREVRSSRRSLGRALRRQRSRWFKLTGTQRIGWTLFAGFAPLLLVGIPLMIEASNQDQVSPCPADGTPTMESVPAMLDDSGAVEKLDLTDSAAIAVTIYSGDVNHGGQVDLREQIGQLMRGLHQVAVCFPAVKTIRADLMAPAERRHDEYGNAVPGSEVAVVSLGVTADDLRSFKPNFDWDAYPVYAASRYVRAVNADYGDVWHRELEREEEIGDFSNSL